MIDKKGLIFGIIAALINIVSIIIFYNLYIEKPTVLSSIISGVISLLVAIVTFALVDKFFKLTFKRIDIAILIVTSLMISYIYSFEKAAIITSNIANILFAVVIIVAIEAGFFVEKRKAS